MWDDSPALTADLNNILPMNYRTIDRP